MASSVLAPAAVDYPSSDGSPVAESDLQLTPITYARDALRDYFRERADVYVAANLPSRVPGLELRISERGLRFHDPATGEDVPSLAERREAWEREQQARERAERGGSASSRNDSAPSRRGSRPKRGWRNSRRCSGGSGAAAIPIAGSEATGPKMPASRAA